jgi:hypothetical protein
VRNADGTLSTNLPDPQPLWAAPIYTPKPKHPRDEQSAFEDWATRICPSGDAELVQYQWAISEERAEWLNEAEGPSA